MVRALSREIGVLRQLWLPRLAAAVAIVVGVPSMRASSGPARLLPVAVMVSMAAIVVAAERRRRSEERARWDSAAASPDPILTLSVTDYVRGLSVRDRAALEDWLDDHPRGVEGTPSEIAAALVDAPAAVAGYVGAHMAPREQRV